MYGPKPKAARTTLTVHLGVTVGSKSNGPQPPAPPYLSLSHPLSSSPPDPNRTASKPPRHPTPRTVGSRSDGPASSSPPPLRPRATKSPPPFPRVGKLARRRLQPPASFARVRTSPAPTSALVPPLLPLFSRGCARNRRNGRARSPRSPRRPGAPQAL